MIIVLTKMPRTSQVQTSLPPENIVGAIRAHIRYVRYSQAAHVLIVRAGLFTLCSSALLSLLLLLARHELRLDTTGFGLLLGSFGTGAIIGGIAILPRLRLRGREEMRSLTMIIKQTIYLDYKAGASDLRHQVNIV